VLKLTPMGGVPGNAKRNSPETRPYNRSCADFYKNFTHPEKQKGLTFELKYSKLD